MFHMIFLYDFIFHNFIVPRICINAIDFRDIICTSDNLVSEIPLGFFLFQEFSRSQYIISWYRTDVLVTCDSRKRITRV